jgi:hypothetical protein
MRNVSGLNSRSSERGAVSIKALLGILIVGVASFIVIKIVPIYTEQRNLIYDVDELARVAAVRNYKDEKINKDIQKIREQYDLPEDSIRLVEHDRIVKIEIDYSKDIDLLVTSYKWQVDYTSQGKNTLRD